MIDIATTSTTPETSSSIESTTTTTSKSGIFPGFISLILFMTSLVLVIRKRRLT
jgi:hypothetical protein